MGTSVFQIGHTPGFRENDMTVAADGQFATGVLQAW